MTVTLDPQLAAVIRQKVDAGLYPTTDEALREAVRLLDEHDRRRRLRALLAVGVEQADRGELIEYTPELLNEISREAEESFLRGETPDPDVTP